MYHNINFQKLGKRINDARRKNNISIKKLAEKLGIEAGSLANIESGNAAPSTELLFAIADILEVPADYLLADSLKNRSAAMDYMIYDLFATASPHQKKRLVEMSKALLKVMDDNNV